MLNTEISTPFPRSTISIGRSGYITGMSIFPKVTIFFETLPNVLISREFKYIVLWGQCKKNKAKTMHTF